LTKFACNGFIELFYLHSLIVSEKPPWGVDNKICIVLYCIVSFTIINETTRTKRTYKIVFEITASAEPSSGPGGLQCQCVYKTELHSVLRKITSTDIRGAVDSAEMSGYIVK